MKMIYFPVKTQKDIDLFKKNKKFEDIEYLIDYIDSEYKKILDFKENTLQLKYASLLYRNVLIYKNINMSKQNLNNIQVNIAYEKDKLIKELEDSLFINYHKVTIKYKKLNSLYLKTLDLIKKKDFEIFTEKYSYIKDELLVIREYLIKKCSNHSIQNLNNMNKNYDVFHDLQITNNIWSFFKNLNYSYYKDLQNKENQLLLKIEKYILSEYEIQKIIDEYLLEKKEKIDTEKEKVYLEFCLLIFNRFSFLFY